jgi:hypothetical protein
MSENESTPPVVCTVSADAVRERSDRLKTTLANRYQTVHEHSDGYTIVFDGIDESLSAVATFVSNELECCSFAEYEIAVAPPYEQTHLTITGPEGTKAMFRDGLLALLEGQQAE